MSNLLNFPGREIFGAGFLQEAEVEEIAYDFLDSEAVPAGNYVSTIVDLEKKKTKFGKSAIDFLYDLRDAEGVEYHARERFSKGSDRAIQRNKELEACGINISKACAANVIGIREEVTVSYDERGYGSFHNRKPYNPTAQQLRTAAQNSRNRLAAKSKVSELLSEDNDDDPGEVVID